MRFLFVLLFVLTACAAPTQTRKAAPAGYPPTPYDIKPFTQSELRETVEYFASAFMLLGIGIFEADWQFQLTDQFIVSWDPEKQQIMLADGITIIEQKKIIVFPWQDCLADSALAHEMLHALGVHHTPKEEKVLNRVVPMAIKDLCAPTYKRKPPPDASKMNLERWVQKLREMHEIKQKSNH